MKVKVFQTNSQGKIEFTCAELEKLLNEVYEDGQHNCNCNKTITWTNPYVNTTPYYSTTCATNSDKDSTTVAATNDIKPRIIINSADAAELSKHIDEIIKNATQNDVFSNLAKELNF
jgi:hypothetical protein